MELEKIDHVLLNCITNTSHKDIAVLTGWSDGATGTVLKRLVIKKLLKKTSRGFYITTENGIKQIKEKYQNKDIDKLKQILKMALYHTINQLAKKHRYKDEYDTLIKNSTKDTPVNNSKNNILINKIGNELTNIFFDSVINNHNNTSFIINMWYIHNHPICKEHGFNFNKSFKKNAVLTKEITSNEIFRSLRIIISLTTTAESFDELLGEKTQPNIEEIKNKVKEDLELLKIEIIYQKK